MVGGTEAQDTIGHLENEIHFQRDASSYGLAYNQRFA
jgi:hypothetical protein